MNMRVSAFLVSVTTLGAAGCTLDEANAPALTGPSTFATSLVVTATPDTLVLNGQQAVVIVEARDFTGGPLANLRVTLDAGGCGHLSQTEVTTGSDGRVGVIYTAPSIPLPQPECSGNADGVTIFATPVGTNAQASNSFTTGIRFLTPSASSSAAVFAVNFTMTKSAGVRMYTFDDAGSVSPGHTIATAGYRWDWSDGATKFGPSVTHDFLTPGTYTATLTITDDAGQSGFKTALLAVD